MEKIGFSEVGGGLLFIMCPCQANTAAGREGESSSVKYHRTRGRDDDGAAADDDENIAEMHKHVCRDARGYFLICHNKGELLVMKEGGERKPKGGIGKTVIDTEY